MHFYVHIITCFIKLHFFCCFKKSWCGMTKGLPATTTLLTNLLRSLMSINLPCGRLRAHKTVTTASQSKEDMKQGNREKMRKWSHTLSTCSKMSHPHWPRTDHGSCCHRLSASGARRRCGDKNPTFCHKKGGGNLCGLFRFCLT